ncbi:MAG TPA: MFS transporter [Phycicoccus sp.]|nr:MFS transporter [Phycicoccus sp.]HQK30990.1 MFS transporter [Phycicoccus sp.]
MSTDAGAATPRPPGPMSRQYLEITLAILALVTVVAFESMAVSTAMPQVARELHSVRGYGLAFSVMLTAQLLGIVLAGVWTDRRGPLPGTFAGQLLFAAGSALCGFAQNYPTFLLGRAITGLGGGLLVVMMYVIAARMYPDAIRPRLFTFVSAAWVLPSLAGPSIAAWMTQAHSWRWVFWCVVLPTVITWFFLMRGRRKVDTTSLELAVSHRDQDAHTKAAWFGLALALAAGAVQLGTTASDHTWSRWDLVSAVGLVGVILTAPRLVPAGTWLMRHGLPSVMLSRALLSGTFFAGVSFVPLLIASVHHRKVIVAGILLALGSIGWAIGAWWQGRDNLSLARSTFITLGGVMLTIGFGLMAVLTLLGWNPWLLALPLIFCGLAMGLGVTTTTVLALEMVIEEEHGETSSALQIADVLGSVLGIAGVTAAFAIWHQRGHDSWLFAGMYAVLAALAALVILAGQRIRT